MPHQSIRGFVQYAAASRLSNRQLDRKAFVLTEILILLGMITASIAVLSPAVHYAGIAARQPKAHVVSHSGRLAQYRSDGFEDSPTPTLVSSGMFQGIVSPNLLNSSGLSTGSWALLMAPSYGAVPAVN